MKLEMRGQMRLEQQMKLAPHMIQSMEILQLPLLALQERIEQELNSNPVLEADESPGPEDAPAETTTEPDVQTASKEKEREDDALDEEFRDYIEQGTGFARPQPDEPDPKLAAMNNTAAAPPSLHDYLEDQWRMVEADEPVKRAGSMIIDYIDERGYLSVRLEQLHSKDRTDFTLEDLQKAIELIQKLDPPGVGARDIRECLLIQIGQNGADSTLRLDSGQASSPQADMSFERELVAGHLDELLENRLPDIAKKMNCSIEELNRAIERLSKFDTSPGLQVGRNHNHPITADVIVDYSDETGEYTVRLAEDGLPRLRISDYYVKMAAGDKAGEKAKQFLQNNIRSAQWIIDAIQQRKNTLLKVTRSIVNRQRGFFDRGQLYLRPLPMAKVAEDVGVHIATVSRAVAGKYMQCSWGILPLRKFFSGGIEDTQGNEKSWEAIRARLQEIIDAEDKSRPLSDSQIKEKLAEAGITGLARRTIAKYRGLLKIPPARLRKKY
ncbi:MAG: RNA polymerase factor sigma-54 [Sedimentisphaerales bacterium]|nr:RNA polymerase factor sigma-54 [Sedimentisphaerales bacterium]